MRTTNRNNHLLLCFLERYVQLEKGSNYDFNELNNFTCKYIDQQNVNQYINKSAIHFGKWLLQRNERTLEHSVEELFQMYFDEISIAPADKQIDFIEPVQYTKAQYHESNWCDSCGGRNCIC